MKTISVEIPQASKVYSCKCPDFEENTVLKESVDFIQKALEELYDLDGKTIFVDEISTSITNEKPSAISFIVSHQDSTITLMPVMHVSTAEEIANLHASHVQKFEAELVQGVTTKEAIVALEGISVSQFAIELVNKQLP